MQITRMQSPVPRQRRGGKILETAEGRWPASLHSVEWGRGLAKSMPPGRGSSQPLRQDGTKQVRYGCNGECLRIAADAKSLPPCTARATSTTGSEQYGGGSHVGSDVRAPLSRYRPIATRCSLDPPTPALQPSRSARPRPIARSNPLWLLSAYRRRQKKKLLHGYLWNHLQTPPLGRPTIEKQGWHGRKQSPRGRR